MASHGMKIVPANFWYMTSICFVHKKLLCSLKMCAPSSPDTETKTFLSSLLTGAYCIKQRCPIIFFFFLVRSLSVSHHSPCDFSYKWSPQKFQFSPQGGDCHGWLGKPSWLSLLDLLSTSFPPQSLGHHFGLLRKPWHLSSSSPCSHCWLMVLLQVPNRHCFKIIVPE